MKKIFNILFIVTLAVVIFILIMSNNILKYSYSNLDDIFLEKSLKEKHDNKDTIVKDLYHGYHYNIIPQVEFLNKVLIKEYGDKYKLYTALFNPYEQIPNIGRYNENAILWLGRNQFEITPELYSNIRKFGVILVSDYTKLSIINEISMGNVYQFPEFFVSDVEIKRTPKYYALIGEPLYVKDYLQKKKLKYKEYTYANIDDLRRDLPEIKAVFIEHGYGPNYNMDATLLTALANDIIVSENKISSKSSPQSLVGEITEYYYDDKELASIVKGIETNKFNEKIMFNKHWIIKYFSQNAAKNRLLDIFSLKLNDTNKTDLSNFHMWVRGGYHPAGDVWLAKDIINALSAQDKWYFTFSDTTYRPSSPMQIILAGDINNINNNITSHNAILWHAFPYIKDNKNFIEYMHKMIKLNKFFKKIAVSSKKMQKYMIDNGVDAKWIPQFTNTDKFYRDYDEDKKTQILFVGSNHYERKIVNLAKKNKLPITIYGPYWPNGWAKSPYIDNSILRKYYSSAKIVLNSQLEETKDFGVIVNRIFDVTACGTMVVSEWVDEIKEVYGDCVPMYKTEKEFVDIINYYLTHDEEREKKAKCAQKITQENFTSRIVAKKFDELIEEIKNENMFVINK